jgi:glycosyltransferase involved in cell wall biosynthesis
MPVGNAMPYLRESVASILGQTHRDFEFVIVDDGTTDGSGDYVRDQAARDSRIRVERFESNRGLIRAGNRAVELARAPLVARMDADDISAPERLERQLEVMARNPDAVVVGAMSDGIDRHGRPVRGRDRWRLLRRSMFPPFSHASMMLRRDAFEALGGYAECGGWHDVELILRMTGVGRVLVLPETLHHFRYRSDSVTHERSDDRASREAAAMRRSMDAIRRGRSHAGMLAPDGDPSPEDVAWTARYRDALLLWAGHPPRRDHVPGAALPDRVRREWHRRHPASLRAILRLAVAGRDRVSGIVIRDGRVREWRYG